MHPNNNSSDTFPQIIPITNKQIVDLTGQRFGRLVVLGFVGTSKQDEARWLCLCDCGIHSVVIGSSLKNGNTKSCGCLQKEAASRTSIKHGMWGTSEYWIWRSMLNRCIRPNDEAYPDYGARGICVCVHWQTSFENFYEDMGARPNQAYSLDRINVEGHYSCGHCEQCQSEGWPANCHWATRIEQANNTRRNHFLEYKGQRLTIAQWSRKLGINARTLHERIITGWTIEKALTTPVRRY